MNINSLQKVVGDWLEDQPTLPPNTKIVVTITPKGTDVSMGHEAETLLGELFTLKNFMEQGCSKSQGVRTLNAMKDTLYGADAKQSLRPEFDTLLFDSCTVVDFIRRADQIKIRGARPHIPGVGKKGWQIINGILERNGHPLI